MKKLTNSFPRQIFEERNIVYSREELYASINKFNCRKTLYYSLYVPTKKQTNIQCCFQDLNSWHFCDSYIDKICFDIDNLNSLSVVKKFHIYLLEHNIQHLITFSGSKGFHVYIFTKNYKNISDNKNTLYNSHYYFINKLNLKNGIDVDAHIIGDVSRIMRIPNTLHLETNLYSIPITTNDLLLGKSYILNKAKKQNFLYTYYGNDLFDISKFDKNINNNQVFHMSHTTSIEIRNEKILEQLPPCIQNILVSPYVHWKPRFFTIKYLLETGYSEIEIDLIMKKFLSGKKHPTKGQDNYQHYKKEHQFKYIQRNKSLFSCKIIKKSFLCPVKNLCEKIIQDPVYL